jgi:2-methylcitrate dehydratase PrpD
MPVNSVIHAIERRLAVGAKTTKEIADFACNFSFNELSPELVAHIKNLATGYMASTLAGAVLPNGRIVSQYVKSHGAVPLAGVSGGGFRTSLELAALANATFAHATELEDVSFPDGLYALAIFAPVFAVGEHLKASGRDVIEGFVIGYDIASRLGVACADAAGKGWMLSAVFASVGVAGAVARMFKLNHEQTTNALSIGASQGTGLVRQSGTGAHTYEAGFAGRNGVTAAQLARAGLNGNPTILEGAGGMVDLIAGLPSFELGEALRVAEIGIRKYPCCGLLQRNIDGVRDLIAEHKLRPDDIANVTVEVNHTFAMYMKYADPTSASQTRFSIEHAVAACFLESRVFLNTFTDEAANDPRFKAFRSKVKMIVHPEWEHGYFPQPSIVTVTLTNGKVIRKECVFARGDVGHPLEMADIRDKYTGSVDFAGTLSQENAEKARRLLLDLDHLKDVSELTNLFTFADRLERSPVMA